jgi:hypothetical protein
MNKTDCTTCVEGYLLYDVDHTCYESIEWYFPFLCLTAFFVIFSWVSDCCYRETNIMHSLIYFLSYLEVGLIFALSY